MEHALRALLLQLGKDCIPGFFLEDMKQNSVRLLFLLACQEMCYSIFSLSAVVACGLLV